MSGKKYTDKQKIAYYKKKAASASAPKKSYAKKSYPKKKRPYKSNGILSSIGGIAGGLIGGPGGAALGSSAGDLMSKILGFGDYQVNVNTLIKPDPVPEFQMSNPRCTVVRHREFIKDVQASSLSGSATIFNNTPLRIQPGDAQTFPWLSMIAQNYEQYRFHGLIFEYKTQSGALSTTGQLGTVVMATQYNSLSAAFQNKQEMENYEFGTSIKASESVIHPVECDPKQTQCNGIFNISTDELDAASGDSRLYDLGRFNIATVGMPTASEIVGELWVSYEVCLMKPRMNPDSGSSCDHWVNNTGAGITAGAPFGTSPTLTSGSDNFTTITNGVAGVGGFIEFDKSFYGDVAIAYHCEGTTGITGLDYTFIGSNGATGLNIINRSTANQNQLQYHPTEDAIHSIAYFSIAPTQSASALKPKIVMEGGRVPMTPVDMDLLILEISTDLN